MTPQVSQRNLRRFFVRDQLCENNVRLFDWQVRGRQLTKLVSCWLELSITEQNNWCKVLGKGNSLMLLLSFVTYRFNCYSHSTCPGRCHFGGFYHLTVISLAKVYKLSTRLVIYCRQYINDLLRWFVFDRNLLNCWQPHSLTQSTCPKWLNTRWVSPQSHFEILQILLQIVCMTLVSCHSKVPFQFMNEL